MMTGLINFNQTKPCNPFQISGVKSGVLRYYGRTHFGEGYWCGVELDEAVRGRHDGQVHGVQYFTCRDGHGVFAPAHKVRKYLASPRKLRTSQ